MFGLTWKQFFKSVGILAVLLAVGGAVVVVSGIVPVAASTGHFAVTKWFLSFSMHRSISTYSTGVEVPDDLDDPDRVFRGAGHYQTACYQCHGSPQNPQPPVTAAMLPNPPYLPDTLHQWDSAELFVILKHGIKFAGMPAWPTLERDDEVWDTVAFLNASRELDAAGYEVLVYGSVEDHRPALEAADVGRATVQRCVRCHGRQDDAAWAFPRLAAQNELYLRRSLLAYRDGGRPSGMMEPVAADLSDEEITALAKHYAALDPVARPPAEAAAEDFDVDLLEEGRQLVQSGSEKNKIAACSECHSLEATPDGHGYPVLLGQPRDYLRRQLDLFAKTHRRGTETAEIMHPIADNLSERQRDAVSAYYASQSPISAGGDETSDEAVDAD